jgi:hypothetical protein
LCPIPDNPHTQVPHGKDDILQGTCQKFIDEFLAQKDVYKAVGRQVLSGIANGGVIFVGDTSIWQQLDLETNRELEPNISAGFSSLRSISLLKPV